MVNIRRVGRNYEAPRTMQASEWVKVWVLYDTSHWGKIQDPSLFVNGFPLGVSLTMSSHPLKRT